jgi:peroxiredoxin
MKKLAYILPIILAPLFSRAQQTDTSTLTKVGDTAPVFKFNLTKTKTADLKDYNGKLVLLDFFATWCPPCRLELPRIQKEVWEKYKDNPKFALLVVDREEGWNIISPFKKKNGFTLPIVPDEKRKIFSLYATQYIPRLVLVDETGKIIYQSIGYVEGDFNKLLDLIAARLN